MTITIGWCHYINYDKPNELFPADYLLPKLSKLDLAELYKNTDSYYLRCPSFQSIAQNIVVVKSPFDLKIKFIDNKLSMSINNDIYSSFLNELFTSYNQDNSILGLNLKYLLVSDTPNIWVDVLPPFLHGTKNNIRVSIGHFNIYNWIRHINYSFEVLDRSQEIIFKKDEPLMYLKLYSTDDVTERIHIKECEFTSEIKQLTEKMLRIKEYVPNKSFKYFAKIFGKRRPKKLLKFI